MDWRVVRLSEDTGAQSIHGTATGEHTHREIAPMECPTAINFLFVKSTRISGSLVPCNVSFPSPVNMEWIIRAYSSQPTTVVRVRELETCKYLLTHKVRRNILRVALSRSTPLNHHDLDIPGSKLPVS